MAVMKIGTWSRFFDFEEVFEYYGVFDENSLSRRSPKQIDGIWGKPHSDNGFRLRSNEGGRRSFSNLALEHSLDDVPCPLLDGEIGCYLLRIEVQERRWDYIGKSRELEHGIWHRLVDHLIKIAGTEGANFNESTGKFAAMRKELAAIPDLEVNSPAFFKGHVRLAFIKVERTSKEYAEHVSKIEGMALAFYKEKTGEFPNLNTTDETKGLDGFLPLV